MLLPTAMPTTSSTTAAVPPPAGSAKQPSPHWLSLCWLSAPGYGLGSVQPPGPTRGTVSGAPDRYFLAVLIVPLASDRSPVTDLPRTSPRQRSVPTRGSPGWRRRGRVFRRG